MSWFLRQKLKNFLQQRCMFVSVREIAREFTNDSAIKLATALIEMKVQGTVEMKYKLVLPNGRLSALLFPDPRDIPIKFFDVDSKSEVNTADCDVMPVFRLIHNNGKTK